MFTMKLLILTFVPICMSIGFALCGVQNNSIQAVTVSKEERVPKQMEYISLINTLLQQTSLLSSVDGVLIAVTTVLASFISRAKPLLITSTISYFMYVGASIIIPGPLARMGLPVLDISGNVKHGPSARAFDDSARMFEGVFGETLVKGLRIAPVMNIVTNVSVSIVSDTMSRLRSISRMFLTQMAFVQKNMAWFTRALSNECVTRFMCRVGQITDTNFPMASSLLRTIGDSYPGMDSYALAIVRGTSSSNCSLIYPDCILP